jgi:hypothetical protein
MNQILAIAVLLETLFFSVSIKPKRVPVRTENNTLHRGR